MERALLDRLQAARAAKVAVAVITDLSNGRQALTDGKTLLAGDTAVLDGREALSAAAIAADRSGTQVAGNGSAADGEIFVQVFNPPLRLIVVGAVHITQVLAPMAALAGYEVVVIDPRSAWASKERFPDVRLIKDWPDDALQAVDLDHRCAVVTVTHDPKLDDPALDAALRSQAFYIGCLGSKKTHAARLERLTGLGFAASDLTRLHGPIGLPIGAKSPAEIAIAILAQATQVRHGVPALVKSGDPNATPTTPAAIKTLPA